MADWTQDDDPWLTSEMSHHELVGEYEAELVAAIDAAMREWLTEARRRVLRTPYTRLAAASPDPKRDLPPQLDGWPDLSVWTGILRRFVLPALRRIFTSAFSRAAQGQLDAAQRIEDFARDVIGQLQDWAWPDSVYDEATRELEEGRSAGETISQLRARLDALLRMSAPVLEIRDRIAERRREGKPVPSTERDEVGDNEFVHRNSAREAARWLTVSTANRATLDAGRDRAGVTGDQLYKVWWATSDQRVRNSHWHAHKQAVPLSEPFVVGGSQLDYPGDKRAPIGEWINCRCALLTVTKEEADTMNADRAAELPNRKTPDGEPIAAAAGTDADQRGSEDRQSWAARVASAVPLEPPREWFSDPQLTGPTKIRVSDEGRVYGHVADWTAVHASFPGRRAPQCPAGGIYPKFHRHGVLCSDGSRVLTGPLATSGHASTDSRVTMSAAMAHYDDPNYVIADVVVGEDSHGIWASGALRPGVSPFQVMVADRYSFSGDWREDGYLIAACSVSVPGFHLTDNRAEVVALAASADDGRVVLADATPRVTESEDGYTHALVASSIVRPPAASAELSELDTERLGWELHRATLRAAATDQAITAAARKVIAPRVEAARARVLNSTTNEKGANDGVLR